MKILFLSQHYKPEPCDTRTSQLAQHLAARGHKTSVITSFPNYPLGKTYEGWRQQIVKKQQVDGVNVIRVPMYPSHTKSPKRRALSYLSFGLSAAILGEIFTKRPNLIWIHHPPLTTGLAGYFLAKIKGVPYVYEIHDLWPETLVSTGVIKEGRITRAIRKVCGFLYKRSAAIVVTSAGMKSHLERQNVEPEKIHVIPQWADEAIYHPVPRDLKFGDEHGLNGKFNVLFAGNLGLAQGLDTVLCAARRLERFENLQIVLVGNGVEAERLKQRVQDEKITNVRFLGQHPAESMPQFFAWADALLIHLKDDPLFAITVPSKTQVYVACGRPILCGVAGDGADVVSKAACGLTFEPEDVDAMANAIAMMIEASDEVRDRFANKARESYLREFGQDALVDRYEALFHGITKIPRAVVGGVESEERTAA
ncbi:MAG: glycosyltransferase family 4 protein [Fimbriimonadaceae bacterium]|nr:glycosyltransferase family 4 protein [Fimbriimonadaceae bacterium]